MAWDGVEPARDERVRTALAASALGSLPDGLTTKLTAGSRHVSVDAGMTIHHEGDERPHLHLVISGLVRVFVSAPDGRSMTVRYCRAGALLGAATLYATVSRPFAVQALAPSELLTMRPDVVRAVADEELDVAKAFLAETSERVVTFVGELSERAFASVRERMGRHLLDLAAERQQGTELVAEISQQQLADAVGSVREVVVRALRELRREGVVETGRSRIIILDPVRLVTPPHGDP